MPLSVATSQPLNQRIRKGILNMRTMTITMEINDEEAGNLLKHLSNRGEVAVAGTDSSATPAPVAPSATEVDVNGVPWDGRYHAKTKTCKADGTWKAASGMDDATKAEAKAYNDSFKASPAAPAAPAAPVAPAAPAAPVAPAAPAAPVAPAAPAAPVAPAAPAAPVAPVPVSFEDLTAGFTEVIARIGQEALMAKLADIYAAAGVGPDGASLQNNETQRAQVLEAIKAL